MNSRFQKIKVHHLAVLLNFALTLSFAPTREAHVLCTRLLLHLKGETFVQGQPLGCVIYIVPNIQFTERREQELRRHSDKSLDDFALALATQGAGNLKTPPMLQTWSNHVLLEWAALRFAGIARQQHADLNPTNVPPTNVVALAAMKSARQAIQCAQSVNPDNGALWLAEASVNFSEKNEQMGLAALRIAATNKHWRATTPALFPHLAKLFEKAGLSKLDAAIEASHQMPKIFALSVLSNCQRVLQQLMIAAVEGNDEQQFSTLLNLLVELRRAAWSDQENSIFNSFRRFRACDELVNAMAKQMGQNPLPELNDVSYEKWRELREQIFQDYLNRHADRATVASFVAQREDCLTEENLRSENRDLRWRPTFWASMRATLAGYYALLTLSLLVTALIFEIIVVKLQKYSDQKGRLPREREFWVVASVVAIASAAVLANGFIASGINSEVGLRLAAPPPLISPNLQMFLLALLASCGWLSALILVWKRGKSATKPWQMTNFFALVYLASVIAMAYFRSAVVERIASGLI